MNQVERRSHAPALSEALRIPHRVQPDLVIEGLALQAGLELRL